MRHTQALIPAQSSSQVRHARLEVHRAVSYFLPSISYNLSIPFNVLKNKRHWPFSSASPVAPSHADEHIGLRSNQWDANSYITGSTDPHVPSPLRWDKNIRITLFIGRIHVKHTWILCVGRRFPLSSSQCRAWLASQRCEALGEEQLYVKAFSSRWR